MHPATDMPAARQHLETPATWRPWLLRGIALLLAVAAGAYGLMAIDTSYRNYTGAANAEVAAARLALQQDAMAGKAIDPAGVAEHTGVYGALLVMLTSPRYAFGDDGLNDTLVHYSEMPAQNAKVLALHNAMGGLLMLAGALQFWPALRRRYPRWHRGFGMLYVGAATIAMFAAITYLLLTPVAQIYDTFTFTVGLWFLAVGVLASIGLSMYHLRRREIAQHQAWMAISFGFLLTAPVQRYLWLAVGMWQPGMSQLEGNFAVTAWLIPFSVLVGYGLFTINRLLQERRPAARAVRDATAFPRARALGRAVTWALLPLLALAAAATLYHFLLAPGLAAHPLSARLVPAGVIALDAAVIGSDPAGRLLFALSTCAGLLLGASLLWRTFLQGRDLAAPVATGLALAAAVAGGVMSHWGLSMGLPSFATLAGGSIWLLGGIVCLVLAALMAWAVRAGEQAWMREWGLFILVMLLGTPSLYASLPLLALLPVPAEYVAAGHLYRIATYAQWFPLVFAFVYSVYGSATRERFAR